MVIFLMNIYRYKTKHYPSLLFSRSFLCAWKKTVFSSMIMKGYIIFLFENKDMIEQLQNSYALFLLAKNKVKKNKQMHDVYFHARSLCMYTRSHDDRGKVRGPCFKYYTHLPLFFYFFPKKFNLTWKWMSIQDIYVPTLHKHEKEVFVW